MKKETISVETISILMEASQEGFEPPTDGLEGRCSILLSYWDIDMKTIIEKWFSVNRFFPFMPQSLPSTSKSLTREPSSER